MKRYGVRQSICLSVCHSMGLQQQTRSCRIAAVGPAVKTYRSIAAAAAGECGQCHVVSLRMRLRIYVYFNHTAYYGRTDVNIANVLLY